MVVIEKDKGEADETRLEHPTLRKRSPETKEVGLSDAARAALLARPSPARLDAPASVPIPSCDGRATDATIPSMLFDAQHLGADTEHLALSAVGAGFLGLDTATTERNANSERGLGDYLRKLGKGLRGLLFVQSKFTPTARGHERGALPWLEGDRPAERVRKSLRKALENLAPLAALGALLLHSPSEAARDTGALAPEDRETWRALEDAVARGEAKSVGACNFNAALLRELIDEAAAASAGGCRPAIVQNRCLAKTGWDREVRDLCRAHGIVYQATGLLEANADAIGDPRGPVRAAAARLGVSAEQVVLRFALQLGVVPVAAAASEARMRDARDVYGAAFQLTLEEVAAIERWALPRAEDMRGAGEI